MKDYLVPICIICKIPYAIITSIFRTLLLPIIVTGISSNVYSDDIVLRTENVIEFVFNREQDSPVVKLMKCKNLRLTPSEYINPEQGEEVHSGGWKLHVCDLKNGYQGDHHLYIYSDGTYGTADDTEPSERNLLTDYELYHCEATPSVDPTALFCKWRGSSTLDGNLFEFEVWTRWFIDRDKATPWIDSDCAFEIMGDEPDLYVSELVHPLIFIGKLASGCNEEDCLLIPREGGFLYPDPTSSDFKLHVMLEDAIPLLSVDLYAYYVMDSTTGVGGHCLVITDNDLFSYRDEDHYWKVLNCNLDVDHDCLEFSMRHVPDNIFDRTEPFGTFNKYQVRIALLEGDWFEVARWYRGLLEMECSWYQGCVGERVERHEMPSGLSNVLVNMQMSEAINHFGYLCVDEEDVVRGDHMHEYMRDMLQNVMRVFGKGVYCRWYGFSYPDHFDGHYHNQGLLAPGKPSLAAAVRESQKYDENIVAPYIQGTIGYHYDGDLFTTGIPQSNTSQNMDLCRRVKENGSAHIIGLPGYPDADAMMMCTGSTYWGDSQGGAYEGSFVENIVDLVINTLSRSVYIDFCYSWICYARDSINHPHHLPGGGSWPYRVRMDQFVKIKERIKYRLQDELDYTPAEADSFVDDFSFSQENLNGSYTHHVAMMFNNPISGSPEDAPYFNWKNEMAVPFFRCAFPNVKMSNQHVGDLQGKYWNSRLGCNAWYLSTLVFTFGQILSMGNNAPEYKKTCGNHPFGPYYDFMKKICRSLSDRSIHLSKLSFSNLLEFHNGIVERIPFNFHCTHSPSWNWGFKRLKENKPKQISNLYIEEALVPGMFRHWNNEGLAFIVANPWNCDDQQLDLEFAAEFRPLDYAEYFGSGTGSYQVWYVPDIDAASTEAVQLETSKPVTETFDFESGGFNIVNRGDIVVWLFIKNQ
ncbi:MAG: DUF6259 domain-containing protein [Planctomycetota bacterium]